MEQAARVLPTQLSQHQAWKAARLRLERKAPVVHFPTMPETIRIQSEIATSEINRLNNELLRIKTAADLKLEELRQIEARIAHAKEIAKEIDDTSKQKISVIIRTVATFYGLTVADLLSERRTANVVRPRQIAMYLAKTLALTSLPRIGKRMGDRDHTTILHGVRKITALRPFDAKLDAELTELTHMLEPKASERDLSDAG